MPPRTFTLGPNRLYVCLFCLLRPFNCVFSPANVDRILFQTDLLVSCMRATAETASLFASQSEPLGEAFDRWRRRRLAWLRRRGINAMPCILLFDSIPSHSRVSNLHVIRKAMNRLCELADNIEEYSPPQPSCNIRSLCVVAVLPDHYLQAEWNVRRSERDGPLHFNKDTIRGFSPRVPSQSNLVDCGIFLLHYVEMFFR
ncbi:unnamed protein product, partial [Dibothriocephalus latus]